MAVTDDELPDLRTLEMICMVQGPLLFSGTTGPRVCYVRRLRLTLWWSRLCVVPVLFAEKGGKPQRSMNRLAFRISILLPRPLLSPALSAMSASDRALLWAKTVELRVVGRQLILY